MTVLISQESNMSHICWDALTWAINFLTCRVI